MCINRRFFRKHREQMLYGITKVKETIEGRKGSDIVSLPHHDEAPFSEQQLRERARLKTIADHCYR